MMRAVLFTLALTLTAWTPAWAQGYMARALNHPVPGGVAVVGLGNGAATPSAAFENKPVMVLQDSDEQWIALVGLDLKTQTGPHQISIKTASEARTVNFNVDARIYPSQHITLKNKQHVNPDPEQVKRYEREYKQQIEAYASFRPTGPSNIVLDRPVEGGRLSSRFGLRRFFNGEERNAHSGLDFAVPAGTPVKAPADGVVTIVADYFFNGKTVFVDHGQGLVTMYCHLSASEVKPGQTVSRGQVIARVGATGRATGPHLHWNVSMNGNRVDPAIFINAYQP
ncbi:M23 family metallopeptidase [Pusillimonas sp. ANT_WB101]|nr:M23 family metallopeptidase [Pusillimonas sp. ANT_WB101]